jgi:hypothetical protein
MTGRLEQDTRTLMQLVPELYDKDVIEAAREIDA